MEKITNLDLAAAFKALNDIETPTVRKSFKTKKLVESTKRIPTCDALMEDYYDVTSKEDLEAAKDEREEEIAKAKLAKIEKIVDLDANSPEELEPSYEGKTIIQCPQCMTMFYKDPADVVVSEEDSTVCNVGEKCQHCGNDSGYTLVGKVAPVEESEADNFEEPAPETEAPADDAENELDLNFDDSNIDMVDEPKEEEEAEPELEPVETKESMLSIGAGALLEDFEEDIIEEPAKTTEETEEEASAEDETPVEETPEVFVDVQLKDGENVDLEKIQDNIETAIADEEVGLPDEAQSHVQVRDVEEIVDPTAEEETVEETEEIVAEEPIEEPAEIESEEPVIEESLTEAKEPTEKDKLEAEMRHYNNYIEYVKQILKQDEEALEEAKKTDNNEFVIKAIEKRIENDKADLEAALPNIVKEKAAETTLPTPEEAKVEESVNNSEAQAEAEENSELATEHESENKTLNESTEVEQALNMFEAGLEEGCCEEKPAEPIVEETGDSVEQDVANSDKVNQALSAFEDTLTEDLPSDVSAAAESTIAKLEEINAESSAEIAENNSEEEPVEEALTEEKPAPITDPSEFEAPEATNANFKKMLNSTTFKSFGEDLDPATQAAGEKAIADLEEINAECEAELDNLDEIKDESLVECLTKSLTNVYENVKSFELSNCATTKNTLIVEGKINFKSGLSKTTKYTFTEGKVKLGTITLKGVNEALADGSEFILTGIIEDGGHTLIVENINYKYHIGDSLVEGLAR